MTRLALALAALVLLAGCPAKPPTSASSTGSRAVDARRPHAGEVYVYKTLFNVVREDEVTAVGTATVTIARTVGFGSSGGTQTVEEPLLGPSTAAQIKPGTAYRAVGTETLTINGLDFPCEIREIQVGKDALREWVSPHWPYLLRTRSGPHLTLELSEVRPPKFEKGAGR